MQRLHSLVVFCLVWMNSRRRSLGIIVVLLLGASSSLFAQNSCFAQCKDRDATCSGLVGRAYAQCLATCEQKCRPATPPPPPLLDPRCGDRTKPGKIICTIDQPNVTKRETAYPAIQFAPNDIVHVEADGCVQTGGTGDTWKRYVNPTGDGTNDKYHGLIRIPTAKPDANGLIRIEKAIHGPQTVTGVGVPLSQLILFLGYEDDDYSDNGYWGHDDGNDDQCKMGGLSDGGPAHVTITIYRGVNPDDTTSRFDFDVLSASSFQPDPNALLYQPQWSWQQQQAHLGQIPSTSMCHEFSKRGSVLGIPEPVMVPNFPDCTDQSDNNSVDLPDGLNAAICYLGKYGPLNTGSFVGHVNWFPVTLEGTAGPIDHNIDDDYSYTFHNDVAGDPLSVNGRSGLHVEFDSDETMDHFQSQEWTKFHLAVDARDDAKSALAGCLQNAQGNSQLCTTQSAQLDAANTVAKNYFAGHTIITGLFGMDGEHDLKAELHPLYAMATRRDVPALNPSDDVWLMFVRNRGDEGFCSSQLWDSGFEDYTFHLPWLDGMTHVDVNWDKNDFEGSEGTAPPTVSVLPPPAQHPGVFVTFHLGPAASAPYIDGTLHLIWTGIPVATAGSRTSAAGTRASISSTALSSTQVTATGAGQPPESDEIENRLQAAINQLPPAQRQQVKKARAIPGVRPAGHRLPPGGPIRMLTAPPALPRIAVRRRAIKAGPATRKTARDAAQIQALCLATHGAPAGLPPEVCKSTVRDHR
jgi:hypothetical protein